MDPDPGGPKTYGSGSTTLVFCIPSEPFLCSSSERYLPVRTRAPCRPAACAPKTSSLHHTYITPQGTVAWEHEGALQAGRLRPQHVIPAPHKYHSSRDSSVTTWGRPAGRPPALPARHPCTTYILFPQGTVAWEHEGALQAGRLRPQHVIPASHSVRDPDLGPYWTPDPGSGIGFYRIPDLGSQSHIFESLMTIFW
jgi:hypothetical protein